MVIFIVLAYVAIGIAEMVPFIKKRELGKLFVYSIFFLGAFVLSVLLGLGVKIPSPAIIIEKIVYSFTGQQ